LCPCRDVASRRAFSLLAPGHFREGVGTSAEPPGCPGL
jgi:hypothetical protein